MTRKIVVGVDGSATARRALEWAAAEAVQRDAALVVLHAWKIPPLAYSASSYGTLADRDELARAAAETLQNQLDRSRASHNRHSRW